MFFKAKIVFSFFVLRSFVPSDVERAGGRESEGARDVVGAGGREDEGARILLQPMVISPPRPFVPSPPPYSPPKLPSKLPSF